MTTRPFDPISTRHPAATTPAGPSRRPKKIIVDLSTIDLRTGDEVAAWKDDADYEVSVVEAHQGRVQVADTHGGVHSYHQNEKVRVRVRRLE